MHDTNQDESQNDESQSGGDSSADQGSEQSSGSNGSDDSSKDKNWLEWLVTIAGAAVVLFVVGFLIYQYGWGSDEPAELVVELGTPSTAGGTVEIPVTVRNTGDKVASAAVIEVCGGPEACAQLTFDYIPFASKQTGSVGLKAPVNGPFETRVVSYRNP